MKLIVPDYYPDFRCIADRCRHSCCIGWEIDIDSDSLARYRSLGGDIGDRLRRCISASDDDAHFILVGDEERCPFLNDRGLCDIIIALDEDALCDICADHPRYRNFFDNRIEMGLGLCCEEAARLILTRTDIPRLITLSDDGCGGDSPDEAQFFALRDQIFGIIADENLSLSGLFARILQYFGAAMPSLEPSRIRALYEPLEYMGDNLSGMMTASIASPDILFAGRERCARQLLAYFLYRHLPDGMYDGTLPERSLFALLSTIAVGMLSPDDILESARIYSSEIEYSDENIAALLDALKEYL